MVIVSMLVVVAAAWVTARRLNRLGRQRSSALSRLAASERRLHQALEQLLHVRENERRGLAMDLHDDVLPALAGVTLQLELARGQSRDRELGERVKQAEGELRSARLRLRHLMFDLVPEALAQEGLGGALRHRLAQMHDLTGVDVELDDSVGREAAAETAAVLYRIALEALRNVSRHAQASRVRVSIAQSDGHVGVTVADDGVGIAATNGHPGHMGLEMMVQRARLVGGDVEIRSERAEGTTVVCWVPAVIDQRFRGG
jgi:signal transduction histidine kinase